MKVLNTSIICLLLLISTMANAQTSDILLAKGMGGYYTYKLVESKQFPGMFVAEMYSTENKHTAEDMPVVENVPLINEKAKMPFLENGYMTNIEWNLSEEDGKTVLNCIFRMPSDIATNLWLASEETCILDLKTGIQYRAISSTPGTWKKYFAVKGHLGEFLNFKIYFPKMPETTRRVAIYGVPMWGMRGHEIYLSQRNGTDSAKIVYDKKPDIRTPRLVKPEGEKYEKSDGHSWSVYTDAHLIKPTKEHTIALWLTPEATYLAMAIEQNWMREYFIVEKGTMLIGPDNKFYKLRNAQGIPLGHIFWMEGYSGDYITFLLEFEPLPADITTVSYIEPDGEPFSSWGANWKGTSYYSLDVEMLRQNQKLFKYQKRKIVNK